jgi:hypothetical protein
MIVLDPSESTRKLIDLTVAPSATGVTVSGSVRWFDDLFNINVVVPCVYSDDAAYRVALCRHASGPALVLVEDDALPAGYTEVCSPIRWRFTQASDTCASVDVHVVRRVLVPEPSTFADVDGVLVETPASPLPAPTVRPVSTTPVLPQSTPERTLGRARRRRIRELTVQARTMRDSGVTFTAMTAGQKSVINELVALLADIPLAVAP